VGGGRVFIPVQDRITRRKIAVLMSEGLLQLTDAIQLELEVPVFREGLGTSLHSFPYLPQTLTCEFPSISFFIKSPY